MTPVQPRTTRGLSGPRVAPLDQRVDVAGVLVGPALPAPSPVPGPWSTQARDAQADIMLPTNHQKRPCNFAGYSEE